MYILFVVLIVGLMVLERRSMRKGLKGIGYSGQINKNLVETGEVVEFSGTITNATSRFLFFLKLSEEFPPEAEVSKKPGKPLTSLDGSQKFYTSTSYLRARSQLIKRCQLTFPQRGCYTVGKAELYGGDFLGFREQKKTFPQTSEIVVYPLPANVNHIQNVLGGLLGDISVRRFIMEDPVLTIGARDYTGSEPLKQISWKHTARTGRMMVKQFDYTAEPMVSILLDINMTGAGHKTRAYIENCYSLTRSVCEQLEKQRISYDFIFNMSVPKFARDRYFREGLGPRHFSAVLEALGRATHTVEEPFHKTVERLSQKQGQNRSTIIITTHRDLEKDQGANYLRERTGGTVTMIYGEDCHEFDHDLKAPM